MYADEITRLQDEMKQLQAKFDRLIKLRDEARLNIDSELGFQKYQHLKKEAGMVSLQMLNISIDLGEYE